MVVPAANRATNPWDDIPVDLIVRFGNEPVTVTVYEPPLKALSVKPVVQLESARISANASLRPASAIAVA